MYTRASETNITQGAWERHRAPLPASAVADGGELLGQAAAECGHECEEA